MECHPGFDVIDTPLQSHGRDLGLGRSEGWMELSVIGIEMDWKAMNASNYPNRSRLKREQHWSEDWTLQFSEFQRLNFRLGPMGDHPRGPISQLWGEASERGASDAVSVLKHAEQQTTVYD